MMNNRSAYDASFAVQVPIIGYMRSGFKQKFGIPRQSNLVDTLSYIEMQSPYDTLEAFTGIEQFSHLWLLWHFHKNKQLSHVTFRPLVRPPRLGGNVKIGVFASRSMYRPSSIGLSAVRFHQIVQQDGQTRLYVRGADLLDGTPILDIKPYLVYADAWSDAKSGYANELPQIWTVGWSDTAQQQRHHAIKQGVLTQQQIDHIEQLLQLNPMPAYQTDVDRVYGMLFEEYNVRFSVDPCGVSICILELQPADLSEIK